MPGGRVEGKFAGRGKYLDVKIHDAEPIDQPGRYVGSTRETDRARRTGRLPERSAGCSGYLVSGAASHPDHCADLLPLLRARALNDDEPCAPLPVLAPAGAVEPLLLGEPVRSVREAAKLDAVADGATRTVAGLDLRFADLPHHVPNLGVRITDGSLTISYTGDAGPSPATVELARDMDLHLAEATHVGPDLHGNEG